MKNIIIYTTDDKILSLHLLNRIVNHKEYENYKIDIFISKVNLFRKIKVLLIIIFFGSISDLISKLKNRISIEDILKKNKNCKIVNTINKNYNFGISVYNLKKINIQNYKIFNFHLGSLRYQRGSFIFFYKFIKNWDKIFLTFHEITEKFDVGKIVNEREIYLKKNCKATDIIFAYLNNFDFLTESLDNLNRPYNKQYLEYDKLNLVPNFYKLFYESIKYFFKRISNS